MSTCNAPSISILEGQKTEDMKEVYMTNRFNAGLAGVTEPRLHARRGVRTRERLRITDTVATCAANKLLLFTVF